MESLAEVPIVIGHRGASGYRIENTLLSYDLAIEMGVDYIEGDLISSQDHEIVASHSVELSETTDVENHPEFASRKTSNTIDGFNFTGWFVNDFTLQELRTLRTKERYSFRTQSWNGLFSLATLEELLQFVRGREKERGIPMGVYLETKHPTYFKSLGLSLEEPLVEILHSFGYNDSTSRVFIESFETNNLKQLKQMTNIPLIQLIADVPNIQADTGRPFSELMTIQGLQEIAIYSFGIGPGKRSIYSSANGTPTKLVQNAHQSGLCVHVWTFRNEKIFLTNNSGTPEEEYKLFFKIGVDGVFTDFPDTALTARTNFLEDSSLDSSQTLDHTVRLDRGIQITILVVVSLVVLIAMIAAIWYLVQRRKERSWNKLEMRDVNS